MILLHTLAFLLQEPMFLQIEGVISPVGKYNSAVGGAISAVKNLILLQEGAFLL